MIPFFYFRNRRRNRQHLILFIVIFFFASSPMGEVQGEDIRSHSLSFAGWRSAYQAYMRPGLLAVQFPVIA
ncbi:hypothetical protein WP5S18E01_13600 [Enterobacter cloacae]|nr:hypothetical protein WP5S18E01_13600 [Enterobacter cloacae]